MTDRRVPQNTADADQELVDRIGSALEDVERPGVGRVLRSVTGHAASPSGWDYLLVVGATDGDVALELGVGHEGRAVIRGGRHVAESADGTYQLAGESAEPRVATIDSSTALSTLASYPVRPVLHSDVAQLFADATEIDPSVMRL